MVNLANKTYQLKAMVDVNETREVQVEEEQAEDSKNLDVSALKVIKSVNNHLVASVRYLN